MPYNITWGSNIYVRISAINAYGESGFSVISSGTVLITKPDAPINIVEDIS